MLRFFCVWIPDFAAWAAARHDPALQALAGQALERRDPARRDTPLLIYRGGRVIAASPAARESGVQVGWSLPRAQALLPEATALPHHAALMALAWQEVLQTLYGLTPYLESLRPGLALASGLAVASLKSATAARAQLQAWGAQAGIADDRTTAELAALTAPPGELHIVPPGAGRDFLSQVAIHHLAEVGISAATIERLGWFGWRTVGDLHSLTRQQLRAQFPEGELLFRYAQARDVRPVAAYWPPPVLQAHFEFEEPVCEPWEWEPVLDHLLEQVQDQLDGRSARTITIGLEARRAGSGAARRVSRKRLLREPVAALPRLRAEARLVLAMLQNALHGHSLQSQCTNGRGAPLAVAMTRLEVELGGLEDTGAVQHNLFAARPAVYAVLAALEARFPGAVQRIVTLDRHAYLPEAGFRLVPLTAADLRPPHVPKPVSRRRAVTRTLAKRRAATRRSEPRLDLAGADV